MLVACIFLSMFQYPIVDIRHQYIFVHMPIVYVQHTQPATNNLFDGVHLSRLLIHQRTRSICTCISANFLPADPVSFILTTCNLSLILSEAFSSDLSIEPTNSRITTLKSSLHRRDEAKCVSSPSHSPARQSMGILRPHNRSIPSHKLRHTLHLYLSPNPTKRHLALLPSKYSDLGRFLSLHHRRTLDSTSPLHRRCRLPSHNMQPNLPPRLFRRLYN